MIDLAKLLNPVNAIVCTVTFGESMFGVEEIWYFGTWASSLCLDVCVTQTTRPVEVWV